MNKAKASLRTPFASALLGGLVVAAFAAVAIATGWIESEGATTTTTTVAAPATAPVADGSGEDDITLVNQIYRENGDGVAFIEAEQPASAASPLSPFGEPEPEGGGNSTGSGFVIDKRGHVLTNYHVVEESERIEVKLGASNTSHPAKVIGSDPATDIAVLEVDAPADRLHPLELGRSSAAEVGDPVVAIGNPYGLDRTVTSGIVSALRRQIQAPNGFSISNVIQTDAAINPGNSGGPLIDGQGRVIGINAQIQTNGGQGNVGIGFAIPIDTVREEIDQLIRTGEVDHAYLGIEGGTITADLARALNLPVEEGILVQSVAEDSPAEKAGLEGGDTPATIEGAEVSLGGDIITEVEGRKVSEMDQIIEIVNEADPGEDLDLKILRGGSSKEVTVTLGERPDSAE